MASIEVTFSAEFSASPDQVFAALVDPTHMRRWVTGVQSVDWTGDGQPGVGQRFDMQYKYGRRVSQITMEFRVVEPSSRVEYSTVAGPYPIDATFEISPAGSGTQVRFTQVAHSDSWLAGAAFLVTGWLARPMTRKQLRKDLARLEKITQPDSGAS